MASLKGDSVLFYSGGTALTLQGDCEYTEDKDMLECTNKDTAGYRDYLQGDGGFKITCSGNIDTTNWGLLFNFTGGIKKTSTVTGKIGPINGKYYGGAGWFSNITSTNPRNGIATYSLEFTGSSQPREFGGVTT